MQRERERERERRGARRGSEAFNARISFALAYTHTSPRVGATAEVRAINDISGPLVSRRPDSIADTQASPGLHEYVRARV